MRRPSRSGLPLAFVLCAYLPSAAQNLESIGKEKPFSCAGALSLNQIFYSSSGVGARREPYSYFASANVNLSLYGCAIPLTFTVSNHRTSFSQPFNRYAFHPSWKWITAHIGYASMSFSPYTLNGHVFLGGGIDISPVKNWKVSALYGRFLKAVEADTTQRSSLPSFKRMGYAVKASYGTDKDFVDLIAFHAEDDPHSIHQTADSLHVTPGENLVVSIGAGKTMFKHFALKGEIACSAMTKDTRAQEAGHHHLLAHAGILFEPRRSSSYYHALKTSLNYQRNGWIIGFAYERIDPEYRTLGAYYFNNDLENFTLNGSGALLDGKLNVAATGGVQRDNLGKTKVSTMRRLVGSININVLPAPRLNLSASYSGFQTYTNIRSQFETINQLTPYDNLDTLNFTQISRNASLSGLFALREGENKRENISINLSWQDAADKQGEAGRNSGIRFFNLNTAYALNLVPRNITISLAFNGTLNKGPFLQTTIFGPSAAITRSFFSRKFRAALSSSYNNTRSPGVNVNSVLNCRLNATITIRKRHNLAFSTVMVRRRSSAESTGRSFTEFTGTAGYSYSFGTRE